MILFTEPLGINPVGKMVRFFTPKARTCDEQPLRLKELAEVKKYFDCKIYYSQLLSVPLGVVSKLFFRKPDNMLTLFAYKTDRVLDVILPPIRCFYRNILLVGRKHN